MSIKLNGATSGSVDIDVPAVVGGDVSLELPGGGTVDRLERAGNILQVVQGSTSTEVVNSTTTYVDTGLSATITPTSASSKVLVMVAQQYYYVRSSSETQGFGIRIYRNTDLIYDPIADSDGPREDLLGLSNVLSVLRNGVYNRTVLDSPNTTSAVTYKTQGRPYKSANSGSAVFQHSPNTTNSTSHITLIEVAS